MSLVEIIQRALAGNLVDEDGRPEKIELLPALTEQELKAFDATLPVPLPSEVADLLLYCRGFDGLVEVDFTGETLSFEWESIFPYALPVASDGLGNFWVIDLQPKSVEWGPIYFACHDAPVILYQSATLARFLSELFLIFTPPFRSEVDDVHEDRLFDVWNKNPGVLSFAECRDSSDAALKGFASQLDESFQIIDLRGAVAGQGFSWGRYGAKTVVKRFGSLPIFAYQMRRSFFQRHFRRDKA